MAIEVTLTPRVTGKLFFAEEEAKSSSEHI